MLARQHGVDVVQSRQGRAVQMNTGARLAKGKHFLTAKSFMPLLHVMAIL